MKSMYLTWWEPLERRGRVIRVMIPVGRLSYESEKQKPQASATNKA